MPRRYAPRNDGHCEPKAKQSKISKKHNFFEKKLKIFVTSPLFFLIYMYEKFIYTYFITFYVVVDWLFVSDFGFLSDDF